MRIVGESKAFLGNSEKIAIEFVIRIFIVKHGDTVAARGQMIEGESGVVAGDRERTMPE